MDDQSAYVWGIMTDNLSTCVKVPQEKVINSKSVFFPFPIPKWIEIKLSLHFRDPVFYDSYCQQLFPFSLIAKDKIYVSLQFCFLLICIIFLFANFFCKLCSFFADVKISCVILKWLWIDKYRQYQLTWWCIQVLPVLSDSNKTLHIFH